MNTNQTSVNVMNPAENINSALSSIPKAELWDIRAVKANTDGTLAFRINPDMKPVVVGDEIVSVVSDRYKLVQHESAFRPIVEGLTVAGVQDFKFSLISRAKDAHLNIYFCDVEDDASGIRFGFRASNSVDGKSSLNYGFSTERYYKEKVLVTEQVVTVWGVRQVCSNGMVMRVPLEWHNVLKEEERTRLTKLLQETAKIRHMGAIEKKIEVMQFVTEAFVLLKNPIKRIIELARKFTIEDEEHAKKLIKKYIGKRMTDRILEQYNTEEGDSLWQLYNAVTFVASHSPMADRTRTALLEKSSLLLEKELRN